MYGDFYCYNTAKSEWRQIKSKGPTPRSGAQIVSTETDGGQIWLFGGEYASPSQLQFIHFKDLWVWRVAQKKWEKIQSANAGPSARSGHRMVVTKKKLFVFGGFHDNNQTYRYFNDVHVFSLESYTWLQVNVGGSPPAPRSGCCMVAGQDGKILVWGGFSKAAVKKDIDRGVSHADMVALMPESKLCLTISRSHDLQKKKIFLQKETRPDSNISGLRSNLVAPNHYLVAECQRQSQQMVKLTHSVGCSTQKRTKKILKDNSVMIST